MNVTAWRWVCESACSSVALVRSRGAKLPVLSKMPCSGKPVEDAEGDWLAVDVWVCGTVMVAD